MQAVQAYPRRFISLNLCEYAMKCVTFVLGKIPIKSLKPVPEKGLQVCVFSCNNWEEMATNSISGFFLSFAIPCLFTTFLWKCIFQTLFFIGHSFKLNVKKITFHRIKAELRQSFSTCVYCMRFQSNYLGCLKPA